jgi:hypothetical protein
MFLLGLLPFYEQQLVRTLSYLVLVVPDIYFKDKSYFHTYSKPIIHLYY